MKGFYSYLFHFNEYTGLWAAFKKDEEVEYMTRMYPHEGSKAIFSDDITDLFKVISRGEFPVKGEKKKTIYEEYGLEPK